MVLIPAKTKYRKHQRGRRKGIASAGSSLSFGEYGLQALDCGWITGQQIESARKALTHFVKRGGKIWVRIFPDKSITARPAETRMGGVKGDPAGYVAVVKPGHVLFELAGVKRPEAEEAMRLAGHKMPIKTRFVAK